MSTSTMKALATQIQANSIPSAGDTCIVTWDGTEYECTAQYDSSDGIVALPSDDFVIIIDTTTGEVHIQTESDADSHTFQVVKVSHGTVGEDYLPAIYNGTDKLTVLEALNAISQAANAGITFTAEAASGGTMN